MSLFSRCSVLDGFIAPVVSLLSLHWFSSFWKELWLDGGAAVERYVDVPVGADEVR